MALGGYKFAGYKCEKPSGATDAQWALLIHKTRIAAFLAANTLAGEIWEQDWANGTIDFNSGDGMIYDLSSNGLNLVSFFKHKTETKYYMIASLFQWTSTPNYGGYRINTNGPANIGKYNSSSQIKIGDRSLFHTVSYQRFPENCLGYGATNYPAQALALVPLGGWYSTSSNSAHYNSSTSYGYSLSTKLYFGYVLKDNNIVALSTSTLTDTYFFAYVRASLVGFDGLTLSSPNDTANIYGLSLYPQGSEENRPLGWTSGGIGQWDETLRDDFNRYSQEPDADNTLYPWTWISKAIYVGSSAAYPFESVVFTTAGYRTVTPTLNSDGIVSKGTFDIDLIAFNSTPAYTGLNTWKPYANGNYLFAIGRRVSSDGCNIYIGWDPSNPDITDENSWTAYTGV